MPILWMTRQVNTAKHSAVLIRPEVENRLVILAVEDTKAKWEQRHGAVCSRYKELVQRIVANGTR